MTLTSEETCGNRLRGLVRLPGGGACALAGFPGLSIAIDGSAWIDPEGLAATLAAIRATGADRLLLLTEDSEVPADAPALLRRAMQDEGLRLCPMPIADFQPPSPAFMNRWRQIAPGLHHHFDTGGVLALCCHYGAGRSGLVCAMIAIERGLTAPQAIAATRAVFDEAIESPGQVDWLHGYHPEQALCQRADN